MKTQGQLGLGDEEHSKHRFLPTKVATERFGRARIGMVAAGAAHSVALTQEGAVFTWGLSIWGALGHGGGLRNYISAPKELHRDMFKKSGVVMVAAAQHQTAAVTAQGKLFVCGFINPILQSTKPRVVGAKGEFGGAKVVTVGMGQQVRLAVTDEGALFTWGDNCCFQMGHGKNDRIASCMVPTRVDATHFGGAKVVAADAGQCHAIALTDDGALYTWGMASYDGDEYMGEDPIVTTGLGHPVEHPIETTGPGHALEESDEDSCDSDDSDEGESDAGGSDGEEEDHDLFLDIDENDDCEFKSTPTRIDPQALGGARVGRCRRWTPATQERAIAFSMITHARLSASSGSWASAMEPEIVQHMVSLAEPWSWPEGRAGELEGLLRLLGGGLRGGRGAGGVGSGSAGKRASSRAGKAEEETEETEESLKKKPKKSSKKEEKEIHRRQKETTKEKKSKQEEGGDGVGLRGVGGAAGGSGGGSGGGPSC